ncbi:MAG TPA: hypothetical protein VGM77_05995 [Gemmatimonadales bacterium]|jgi:hypothetical protein
MRSQDAQRHQSYLAEVSAEMQRRYALTWADACGDDQPLSRAREAGRTPVEFVAWWGEKYQLTERVGPG